MVYFKILSRPPPAGTVENYGNLQLLYHVVQPRSECVTFPTKVASSFEFVFSVENVCE
jgi:hypothetical protein